MSDDGVTVAKIDEVAAAAGVSISTVSYALSGKRPVSAATKQRVDTAVRELGYSPNASARTLAGSRTQIFALTEPLREDTHAPTHMAFVLAAAVAARKHDYDILLLTEAEAQAGMRRVAASGIVDAILVLDVAADDPRVPLARQIDTPTVFIGVPNDNEGLICVDQDLETAGALAIDRLADAGHRRIGVLGQTEATANLSNFPPRVYRSIGTRANLRGVHLSHRPAGAVLVDPDVVRTAVRDMLDDGVTALLLHCPDDAVTIALAEMVARGITVPQDVSVISLAASPGASGDIDEIPLIPEESCSRAVDLALACMETDPPAPGVRLVPPTYIEHGSVAAVRTT